MSHDRNASTTPLDTALDAMPRSVEPERDLWPAIEARLEPREVRNGRRWLWPAAAAVLLVVGSSLFSPHVRFDDHDAQERSTNLYNTTTADSVPDFVQRLDPVGARAVSTRAVQDQRATRDEPLEPLLDVGRQPLAADVGALVVVREVQAAAQPATGVAELEVLFGDAGPGLQAELLANDRGTPVMIRGVPRMQRSHPAGGFVSDDGGSDGARTRDLWLDRPAL